jgi:hypothetical protein
VNSLHELELAAVAMAGFLLGCALRGDWIMMWQALSRLLAA